jgi:hypothetical protein
MVITSPDRLYAEMAALALAFGWSRDSLLRLDHAERREWVVRAAESPADRPSRGSGGAMPTWS